MAAHSNQHRPADVTSGMEGLKQAAVLRSDNRATRASRIHPIYNSSVNHLRNRGVCRVGPVKEKTDEALLAEHLAGQPGAFESLAARYLSDLFGFLHRFVGNSAAAEDLVQETLLQIHSAAGSFDPARSFKPWLYTVAANKARDFLRFRGRRSEQSLDLTGPDGDGPSPIDAVAAGEETIEAQVDQQERAELVRKLIARMPEHLRLILMLGYFQQLPYAEIAEVLEIPVGTVKSRLHAAVTYFAKLWQNEALRGAKQPSPGR